MSVKSPYPAILVSLFVAGCDLFEYQIDVHEQEDGSFAYAQMPEGTVYYDFAAYENAASRVAFLANEVDLPVTIRILGDGQEATVLPTAMVVGGEQVLGKIGPIKLFGYAFTSGPLKRNYPIGGCVSGNTDLEYSIRLNQGDPGVQVFDLHLAIYRRQGQWCYGAYESVIKSVNHCECGSPPSRDQITQYIYAAAVAAGVYATYAWSMALAAAPVAKQVLQAAY